MNTVNHLVAFLIFYQNDAMRNTADMTGGKHIVCSQSISGVSTVNPLVAFHDMHGKMEDISIKIFDRVRNRIFVFRVMLRFHHRCARIRSVGCVC
jgi:hypothetical protein